MIIESMFEMYRCSLDDAQRKELLGTLLKVSILVSDFSDTFG
jgi:hypothetical protein